MIRIPARARGNKRR